MNESQEALRAIVTGASSGIGEHIARSLAARGYRVVLVGRRGERLVRLAEQIGHRTEYVICDLSNECDVSSLIQAYPRTTVLVNCAGFANWGKFANSQWDQQRAVIMVNALTPARLCHHYLAGMIEQGRGHILNVSSTAGESFAPLYSTYVGAKAFVLQFTRSLGLEMPPGVTVTCLIPGPTATEFCTRAGMREARGRRVRLQADPLEVAEFAVRLMEAGALSGSPGIGNTLKRVLKRCIPEGIWSKIIRRRMAALEER